MAATAGYQAGIETNNVELSYINEATWGTLPASAFTKLRFMSESLSSQKQRQRATEIDSGRQAADMVTTQETAGGSINCALSYGVYDDFFASLFCADWATGAGQDTLTNSTLFKSLFIQKKLASNMYLRYAGAYVTSASISMAVGGFVTCNFGLVAKSEAKSTSEASTGAATAAATGKIFNTIGNVGTLSIGGSGVAAAIESFQLDIANEGASAQYGIGSSAAQGVLPGVFTVGGRLRTYFEDFTLYDRFAAETEGAISLTLTDADGDAYTFDVLNSVIMNPQIVAGGPGQSVMAEFAIEGRKAAGGSTMTITRNPA